ncbi:uncharacterized protein ARMOST_02931 [Armillaria ostoyae]|uniref:Reverse transcriptase domain-containing protein n=1 Tax=Armillaria ostoyae TaxID=47428 RepID=A0A284QT95_ARMOS|nr:uncharacterized protein ARMOST_02931 [Armillaria ostoyae]
MFFRLTNSPATFQWMMNDIFKDLIMEEKVTIYLDDILIFTKTLQEHREVNYSKIVCPFTKLTGNTEWTWRTTQNQAFQQLKKQMAEDVILAIPNKDKRFRVEADASEGVIRAVLSQEQNGKWRPVAFMSKVLTVTECNYEIYDKELLAIMLALSKWCHYLMRATEDVEIWTDHQNL